MESGACWCFFSFHDYAMLKCRCNNGIHVRCCRRWRVLLPWTRGDLWHHYRCVVKVNEWDSAVASWRMVWRTRCYRSNLVHDGNGGSMVVRWKLMGVASSGSCFAGPRLRWCNVVDLVNCRRCNDGIHGRSCFIVNGAFVFRHDCWVSGFRCRCRWWKWNWLRCVKKRTRFPAWCSATHGALTVNGGSCRGGWSWWLKIGLGFHVWDGGDDDVAMSNWCMCLQGLMPHVSIWLAWFERWGLPHGNIWLNRV